MSLLGYVDVVGVFDSCAVLLFRYVSERIAVSVVRRHRKTFMRTGSVDDVEELTYLS